MQWLSQQRWLQSILRWPWVQRLLNEAARRFGPPDVATMSDEVLDTHLAAESARARAELSGLGVEHSMLLLAVQARMLWDAVPPEERERLAAALAQMRRDHARLSPQAFREKYQEFLPADEGAGASSEP